MLRKFGSAFTDHVTSLCSCHLHRSPGLLSDQLLVGYMIYEMDAHEVNNHVCLLGDPWQLQVRCQGRGKEKGEAIG